MCIEWLCKLFSSSSRENKTDGRETMQDPADRKNKYTQHMETLSRGIDAIRVAKGIVEREIASGKVSLENLDLTEYQISSERDLLLKINPDNFGDLDDPTWTSYSYQTQKDINLCASLCEYRDGLSARDPIMAPVFSGTLATSSSTATPTIYVVFNDTPVATDDFKSTAARHAVEPHPVKLSEFIYTELRTIDSASADRFQGLMREYRASDPDMKYARLMDIRNLLFYQLFETLCPDAACSRTDWYSSAVKGDHDLKKRYYQPKYFILGNTPFNTLSPLLQSNVNKTCQSIFDIFNDLSNYGKHGATEKMTDVFMNSTLESFSTVLTLRQSLYS